MLIVCAGAARAGTFTTYEALEYARPAGSAPLLMDLRVPDGSGPFPVILFLHSGAWISGAAVLGSSAGIDELEGIDLGNAQFSSAVRAVVDLYGPVDLLTMDAQKLPCYPGLSANDAFMPPSLLIGCPIQSCPEKTATSNPIVYADSQDPPFLIMQGKLDCLTPWQQSQELYDALQAAGVAAKLVYLPTAQHADDHFNSAANEAIIDGFLDYNLKGSRRRAATPSPAAPPSSSPSAAPASR